MLTLQSEMPIAEGQYNIADQDAGMPDQGVFQGPVPRMVVQDGVVIVLPVTFWGPIWLEIGQEAPPDEDTDDWDVVVQLDVHAEGGLRARPWASAPLAHLAHGTGNYRLRLYARGLQQTDAAGRGAGEPLREALERHLVLCWPVDELEPARELKRAILI